MVPEQSISEFRLDEITLRGVGSYLHTARLELKPLTILCGTNGSGKSTWVRVIDVLSRSAKNALPFSLIRDIEDGNYQSLFNVHISNGIKPIISKGSEELYGSPGTIGLHFTISKDYRLSTSDYETKSSIVYSNPFFKFLRDGDLSESDKVSIFITCPDNERSYDPEFPLKYGLKFILNGSVVNIVLNDPSITYEGRKKEEFTQGKLFCSRNLTKNNSNDLEIEYLTGVRIFKSENELVYYAESLDRTDSDSIYEDICNLTIQRCRQILEKFLDCFFHIGAIRAISKSYTYDDHKKSGKERYVGYEGEYTLSLIDEYSLNTFMHSLPDEPISGHLLYYYNIEHADIIHRALSGFYRQENHDVINHLLSLLDDEGKNDLSSLIKYNLLVDTNDKESIVRIINTLLANVNLYKNYIWSDLSKESKIYLIYGLSNIHHNDLIRFNRILLDNLLSKSYTDNIYTRYIECQNLGLVFYVFYSKWLAKLLNIKFSPVYDRIIDDDWEHEHLPTGFLRTFESEKHEEHVYSNEVGCMERYTPLPIEGTELSAIPAVLSSGFHQISPMITQLGLMKMYEICAIENPEVHLHPNLQLSLTEFFISQAKIGKFVLIETHSDLIVRRIIRDILLENINQDWVRIYFTDIVKDDNQSVYYSKIEKISINESGQIDNWPKGFMDDDIRESRLLLNVVYGKRDDLDDESDE